MNRKSSKSSKGGSSSNPGGSSSNPTGAHWTQGMLDDPTNQIPGMPSNPGGSSSNPTGSHPGGYYYPNFPPQYYHQPQQFQHDMYDQFQQQLVFKQRPYNPNFPPQYTTSDQYSNHVEEEEDEDDEQDEEEEEEPVPTPTSKPRGKTRVNKSMAKKTVPKKRGPNKKKAQVEEESQEDTESGKEETERRQRVLWSQEEELLLAETYIQISEDPKNGSAQKLATFWYKVLEVYNKEAEKRGYVKRTKNMLTGKWTPMSAAVKKFNDFDAETLAHSGEGDGDRLARVRILYECHTGGKFKHEAAWGFLKGRHKFTNPDSTQQRRNRLYGTDTEPDHFGEDTLPRPPGMHRIYKSQKTSSNSTASSGSNPMLNQEFMAEQLELDRQAKIKVLEEESQERRKLIASQKLTEDMKIMATDTSNMEPAFAAFINAQKERLRAEYGF